MKTAICFSILASLAITIIPAHQASALDANVKHKTLTTSQKRILANNKLVTYQTQRNLNSALKNRGSLVSLNPQPLPPASKNRGSLVSLNPQPLPPGPPPPDKLKSTIANRGSAVSLNPQPLPPGPPPEKFNSALNRDRILNLQQQQLDRRTTGIR